MVRRVILQEFAGGGGGGGGNRFVFLPASFFGGEMEEADLRAAHEWSVERTLFILW